MQAQYLAAYGTPAQAPAEAEAPAAEGAAPAARNPRSRGGAAERGPLAAVASFPL